MKTFFAYVVLAALLLSACTKEGNMLNTSDSKSGSITRFAMNGSYMYVLDQNKILTYSVADKAKPELLNQVTTDYGLETITIYEGTGYVGSRTALYILDISNAAAPTVLSKSERGATLRGGCDPVAVKGNYAYSTIKIAANACGRISANSQLLTYDISDKLNPQVVNRYTMSQPNGLGYSNNCLFVCDGGNSEVGLFDISDPSAPQPFSAISLTAPIDVIVNGHRLIVSTLTGFSFYDITDVNNIRLVGAITRQ